jgi:cold shock CspA family protein
MAIAVLKSFDRDRGLAIIKLDGKPSEVAIRVVGSDRSVVSAVLPGQRIRFDLGRDRRGRSLAVDVRPA